MTRAASSLRGRLREWGGTRDKWPAARFLLAGLFTLALVAAAAGLAGAQPALPAPAPGSAAMPGILGDIGIDQNLGAQLPLDLAFRDERGERVTLRDLLGGKPAVLALVYYECPMLCTQVLNGLAGSLEAVTMDAGREFNVITLSFDPQETAALAAAKKATYLGRYRRPTAEAGWRFLTADSATIASVTETVGFHYVYDPDTRQFAHASGLTILTPEGRIARYLYGIEYPPRDLRLALVEASRNEIGGPVDKVLLYCYAYDPATGAYGAIVMNMVRIGGVLTVLAIVVFILIMRRFDRRKALGAAAASSGALPVVIPLLPEQASTLAPRVDALFAYLCIVSIVFSLLIGVLVIVFAVRYRRRSAEQRATQIHGSKRLEIAWSVIPLALSLVMFFWGVDVFFSYARPPANALDIYVVAKQWMWKFQHMEGQRELNQLHVPVGRAVRLTMASEDVIHSFFVPAFRVKADVVPGRFSTTWFSATKTGRYHLFCAEYCGNKHSGMIGEVIVLSPDEYQRWLSGGAGAVSLSAAGEELFKNLACNTCHKMEDGARGPALEGLFGSEVRLQGGGSVVADEKYLRESILAPAAKMVEGYGPIMPTFQGQISEEGLLSLLAYIKSLGPSGGANAPRRAGVSSEVKR